jgi:hypothetical protein
MKESWIGITQRRWSQQMHWDYEVQKDNVFAVCIYTHITCFENWVLNIELFSFNNQPAKKQNLWYLYEKSY